MVAKDDNMRSMLRRRLTCLQVKRLAAAGAKLNRRHKDFASGRSDDLNIRKRMLAFAVTSLGTALACCGFVVT